MGSGFSKMKKQARAMQEQMEQMRSEMKSKTVTGSVGKGLVEVVLNGEKSLLSVKLHPDCVRPDDIEGLQDLLVGAFRDAEAKLEENKELPSFLNLSE